MTETIVIFSFWLLGSVIGHLWMHRLIVGFPSRMAVDVLAIGWGVIVAVCAKFIIVFLDFALIATLITYFVGAVVSGTTAELVNRGPTDEVRMAFDYVYYKREVLAVVPRITYAIVSVILFFVWT